MKGKEEEREITREMKERGKRKAIKAERKKKDEEERKNEE